MLLHCLGKGKPKTASFYLNAECFSNRHTKHIHIITWSQLNYRSFAQESAIYTKQNLGKQYRMLPSVATHSSFSKSVVMSVADSLCQKWELFSVDPKVKSQWTALAGYFTISTNTSYQTRCRRQYYLPFSYTAHAWTSAWCAQHSSIAAVQNP